MTYLAVSGVVFAFVVGLAAFIAKRVRKFAADSADAQRRAADALMEMQILSKELRERRGEIVQDDGLTPGERLLRLYGGVKPEAAGSSAPQSVGANSERAP